MRGELNVLLHESASYMKNTDTQFYTEFSPFLVFYMFKISVSRSKQRILTWSFYVVDFLLDKVD
jgi:hypothetical protein